MAEQEKTPEAPWYDSAARYAAMYETANYGSAAVNALEQGNGAIWHGSLRRGLERAANKAIAAGADAKDIISLTEPFRAKSFRYAPDNVTSDTAKALRQAVKGTIPSPTTVPSAPPSTSVSSAPVAAPSAPEGLNRATGEGFKDFAKRMSDTAKAKNSHGTWGKVRDAAKWVFKRAIDPRTAKEVAEAATTGTKVLSVGSAAARLTGHHLAGSLAFTGAEMAYKGIDKFVSDSSASGEPAGKIFGSILPGYYSGKRAGADPQEVKYNLKHALPLFAKNLTFGLYQAKLPEYDALQHAPTNSASYQQAKAVAQLNTVTEELIKQRKPLEQLYRAESALSSLTEKSSPAEVLSAVGVLQKYYKDKSPDIGVPKNASARTKLVAERTPLAVREKNAKIRDERVLQEALSRISRSAGYKDAVVTAFRNGMADTAKKHRGEGIANLIKTGQYNPDADVVRNKDGTVSPSTLSVYYKKAQDKYFGAESDPVDPVKSGLGVFFNRW